MSGKSSTAARRYAEAVFELGMRDDAIDVYGDELDQAVSLIGTDRVQDVLGDPARPLGERQALADKLIERRVPDPVHRLVALLVERGKVDRLAQVAREYRRLRNEERGQVEALAVVASPLTSGETTALAKKLAAMTGKTVDLRVEVDEALIGGLTVRVGDTLYDASVRGRLERLRERLVAGAR
ncbi:MAG TPA: ATP synthase F1 subunit delta [Candidatus Limnocylindrales bacterium]|jgi:F-type H+-transporting ATPase subunit delta|nr:ATP synthase F1 subunit delta [Candidatus Limnocylindrales bacterium]